MTVGQGRVSAEVILKRTWAAQPANSIAALCKLALRWFGDVLSTGHSPKFAVYRQSRLFPHSGTRCLFGRATAAVLWHRASLHVCTNSPVAVRTEADLM
jgi:hypothetical protein